VDSLTVEAPALPTAEEFLRDLQERGARVYRMREAPFVFCLTGDSEVAAYLHEIGATPYLPRNAEVVVSGLPLGAYRRAAGGTVEWDFWLQRVPVEGEETIWDAAGRLWSPTEVVERTVEPTEFA
jgi:hypothetical protein